MSWHRASLLVSQTTLSFRRRLRRDCFLWDRRGEFEHGLRLSISYWLPLIVLKRWFCWESLVCTNRRHHLIGGLAPLYALRTSSSLVIRQSVLDFVLRSVERLAAVLLLLLSISWFLNCCGDRFLPTWTQLDCCREGLGISFIYSRLFSTRQMGRLKLIPLQVGYLCSFRSCFEEL